MKGFKLIATIVLMTSLSMVLFANGQTESAPSTANNETKWPTKPIQIVVAAKAGGVTDLHARNLTPAWTKVLNGNAVAVVNQGNALVAYQQVKTANPDGYTILMQHDTLLCTYATGATDINPIEDYEVVGVLEDMGLNILIAGPKAPYNTVPEMATYAKAHPGEVSCAIATNGFTHFMWGAIAKGLGVQFKMVQAANGADKLTNVAGGFISLGNVDAAAAQQYEAAGKIKVIGATAAAGYKDPEGTKENWKSLQGQGIDLPFSSYVYAFAPKGSPRDVLEKMNASLQKATKDPDFVKSMEQLGCTVIQCMPLDESKAFITKKLADYIDIANELGIKAK